MADIAATWMRGGTSKCWVFQRDELEVPGWSRDDVLLRVFGSPDPRQVDGVGGGTSTTSKAVIVSPSAAGTDWDVDYTFAQVGIEEQRVDWGSNCGNCSSVIGLYAVRNGWVPAVADETVVRVHNTNTNQLIMLHVRTPGGVIDENGTEFIPGVPFPGIGVQLSFVDPAGVTTGALFPSGSVTDTLDGPDGPVEVTLIDAGAPVVIVSADAVGLTGNETPSEMDARPDVLALLEDLRRQGAVKMALAADKASAARAIPKLALVAEASGDDADLTVRMASMGKVHPALAITGSVALTMAAREPGSVIAQRMPTLTGEEFRMATPAGVVTTWTGEHSGAPFVRVLRTTRRLAEATLILPDREVTPPAAVSSDKSTSSHFSAPRTHERVGGDR
jgi:2-methylaconitate cis-trans-isomerase PrpF